MRTAPPAPSPATAISDDFVVIASYSRTDALADGALVDVTPLGAVLGFRYPIALTATVLAECQRGPQGEDGASFEVICLLAHLRDAARHAGPGESRIVLRHPFSGSATPVEVISVCGPGDTMDPVLTIMTAMDE